MNDTIAEAEVEAPSQIPTLTTADRCDLCGSRAYVQVTFSTGDLLFCGHHSKKFATKIEETGTIKVDDTSFI